MCQRREAKEAEIEDIGMRCDKIENMGHNEVGVEEKGYIENIDEERDKKRERERVMWRECEKE